MITTTEDDLRSLCLLYREANQCNPSTRTENPSQNGESSYPPALPETKLCGFHGLRLARLAKPTGDPCGTIGARFLFHSTLKATDILYAPTLFG